MSTNTTQSDCCQICEKCAKCGQKLFCLDRHWFVRAVFGEQRVPQYGWCNHFVKARQTRTR